VIGEKLGPELWARILSLHTSMTKKEQKTSMLAHTRARFYSDEYQTRDHCLAVAQILEILRETRNRERESESRALT
jgi:hypothetical protein